MYPNIYCKRKNYGNNYNHYQMMISPSTEESTTHASATLHAFAPPFEPKGSSQTQNESKIVSNSTNDLQDDIHTDLSIQTIPMLTTNNSVTMVQDLQQVVLMSGQGPTFQQAQLSVPYSSEPQSVIGFHPLQHIWTLWYLETDRSKTWEEMQNEISSINNVEDFWRLYNHIKPVSEIKAGCDYSLFKSGIRPMWEDEANREGGRWFITLPRTINKSDLDSLWLDVLLCLIGETFDHSDQICGAVVNVRSKSNKISVWTSTGQDAKAILEIGCKLRDILRLGPHQLQYQLHRDTMAKAGSGVQSLYVI